MDLKTPLLFNIIYIKTIRYLYTYNKVYEALITEGVILKKYGVGTYFAALGVKSGELFDTAKIKLEILSLKKRRQEAILHIGSSVYKMFLHDKFDQKKITEKCKNVVELNAEIEKKEKEIGKVHESASIVIKRTLKGKKVANKKDNEDEENTEI